MTKKNHKKIVWALMLTIAVDMMGFLLVFPLFPALLIEQNSVLAPHASLFMHYVYYAVALAVWPIGNFLGTAFLGEMSDSHGRKKILLMGLFMVFLTYGMQAVGIYFRSVFVFILARFIQGFFGGNYDIAQAAVADISLPEEKARNMGLIALAVSAGMILGPIISALSTIDHTQISITTPFWIAGLMALFNLFWIMCVYKETYRPVTKKPFKFAKIFSAFLFVFQDARVRRLSIICFLFTAGWGLYIQYIPVIMQKLYHLSPHMIGFFFLVLGVGFVLAMQFIQPLLIKRCSLKSIYVVAMIILTILLLMAGLFPNEKMEWIVVFFLAIFHVTGYGCLLAMISNAVTQHEQGQVMGGTGSVGSLAFGMTALLLIPLSMINILIPLLAASVFYFASGMVMTKNKNKRRAA